MNYRLIYINLVLSRKYRGFVNYIKDPAVPDYVRHHINYEHLPYFIEDLEDPINDCVLLTKREHALAHALIYKAYPNIPGKHIIAGKFALFRFKNNAYSYYTFTPELATKTLINAWKNPNSGFHNPIRLINHKNRIQELWANPNSNYNSKEQSIIKSNNMIKRWKNPDDILNSKEFRQKLTIIGTNNIKYAREKLKQYYNNEEYMTKVSNNTKKQWANKSESEKKLISEAVRKAQLGMIPIHNTKIEKRWPKNKPIPKGWQRGQLWRWKKTKN